MDVHSCVCPDPKQILVFLYLLCYPFGRNMYYVVEKSSFEKRQGGQGMMDGKRKLLLVILTIMLLLIAYRFVISIGSEKQEETKEQTSVEETGEDNSVLHDAESGTSKALEKILEKDPANEEGDKLPKEENPEKEPQEYGDQKEEPQAENPENQPGKEDQGEDVPAGNQSGEDIDTSGEIPQRVAGDTDIDFEKMIENIDKNIEAAIEETLPEEE